MRRASQTGPTANRPRIRPPTHHPPAHPPVLPSECGGDGKLDAQHGAGDGVQLRLHLQVREALHAGGDLVAGGGVPQQAANLPGTHVLHRVAPRQAEHVAMRTMHSAQLRRHLHCCLKRWRSAEERASSLTASMSRLRLRSSSLRSSSYDSCCSNWRSGCCSGHRRSSKACGWGKKEGGGRKGRQSQIPHSCAHANNCSGQPLQCSGHKQAAMQPCHSPQPLSSAHLAHGEAELCGRRPVATQADLEEGSGDAWGVAGDIHQVSCQAEAVHPRAADVRLQYSGRMSGMHACGWQ